VVNNYSIIVVNIIKRESGRFFIPKCRTRSEGSGSNKSFGNLPRFESALHVQEQVTKHIEFGK
jgi:hypothetical protein